MAKVDGPVSRRKPAADAPPKHRINWRSIAIQLAVVAVIVLLFVVVNRNGGAPQGGPTALGTARAQIVDWQIRATHDDGSEETLCRMGGTCSLDDLWPAAESGAACTFRSTLWLGATNHPFWARSIDAQVNATLVRGDLSRNETGVANVSTVARDQPLEWTEGAWFRMERATVAVDLADVPCDLWQVTMRTGITGRTWTGGDFATQQVAAITLHADIDVASTIPPGGGAGGEA